MLYVYAFCPRPHTPLTLPEGMSHSVVQVVTTGELSAIAEVGIDIAALKEDDEQLMQAVLIHDRVLGHLFEQTALLPLRFGTQFTSEESLQKHLQAHHEDYQKKLTILSDKAEYLLKLAPKPLDFPPIGEELQGRDYFLAKKQRLQSQNELQKQQEAELTQFLQHLETAGADFVLSPSLEGEERINILLKRDSAIAQAQITEWQHFVPSWDIFCSEPLPPYHFAT